MLSLVAKEVRPIMLPAAAVIALALLAMAPAAAQLPLQLQFLVFVFGCAYLAAVPFGIEFQQRTFGMLLSQPSPRLILWGQKMAVIAATGLVLAAACYAISPARGTYDDELFGEVLMSLALTVCSACFWTLVGRSIIGGAAFTLAGQILLMLVLSGIQAALDKWPGPEARVTLLVNAVGLYVALGASCVSFLWLGWRKFSRFQVVDGVGTPASTTEHENVGRALPRMLQPRTDTPNWNLVRKELLLHKAAFSLSVLFFLCWAVASGIHWLAPERVSSQFVVAIGLLMTVITALLAGSLSLAEENTIGTAEWHRTLPVSWKRQWAVKIGVAAFVTMVVGVAVPFLCTALAVDFSGVGGKGMPAWQLFTAMLCLGASLLAIGVWSSALAANTVRAAASATLMAVVLISLFELAGYVARETTIGRTLEEAWSAFLVLLAKGLKFTPGDLQRIGDAPWLIAAVSLICFAALVQSWEFYRTSNRGWPGISFIFMFLAGGIGLWTGDSWGWLNGFGCVAVISLLWFLLGKRGMLRPKRASKGLFTATVLALVGFTCWLNLLTFMEAITTLSRSAPPLPWAQP